MAVFLLANCGAVALEDPHEVLLYEDGPFLVIASELDLLVGGGFREAAVAVGAVAAVLGLVHDNAGAIALGGQPDWGGAADGCSADVVPLKWMGLC